MKYTKSIILTSLATLVVFIPTVKPMGDHPSSINQVASVPPKAPTKLTDLPQAEINLASYKELPKPPEPVKAPESAPVAKVSSGCEGIRNKLARLGVPANQLDSAIKLAIRESTCNEYVVNDIGACGAFQSLPCGKWGAPGTDQYYQGAINYANSRYGGYNQALAHSLANNWY